MVDDNPQDLVHDVVAEAVFGGHPLGRPVIGRAEVISSVSRRALTAYHRAAYAHDNVVVAAAGNVAHERAARAALQARIPATEAPTRRLRKPFGRPPAPGYRFERRPTEQYHVCLGAPGISRTDERRFAASLLDSILGGSRPRRGSSRRSARSAAWRTPSTASPPSTPTRVRSGSTSARARRTWSPCLEIVAGELGDVAAGNVRPGELERAKENLKGRMLLSLESTSNRMSRLGKVARHRRRAALARRDRGAGRRRHGRRRGGGRRRAAPARPALGRGDRAERGALPGGRAARQPGARRAAGGVKVLLLGRRGKVGSVLGPALEAAGHELVESTRDADAAVDFTRPRGRRGERAGLSRGRRAGRDRDERIGRGADRGARPGARAAGLLRAELRARRGADDALRGGGGRRCCRTPRSWSCTTRRSSTPLRHGEGDGGPAPAGDADPLGPPAGPRGAPGGDLRRRRDRR